MKRSILVVAIVALGCFHSDVRAATLFGRVIEVNSGDVITIFNLNRPVRVKLLGVDAPEMGQTFGDVAKKHLSDLVYDRSVLVEYSGIAADSSLTGRVLLNDVDIGAQMIRDGAAWFDLNNQTRLSVFDREVYQQSEQAARSERRGLWQTESPMAPWEFVKADALRKNPAASLKSMSPAVSARAKEPIPELTNLSLIAARFAAAPPQPTRSLNSSDLAGKIAPAGSGTWRMLRPTGANFSVLVPEEGDMVTLPIEEQKLKTNVKIFIGRDGWSVFQLMWITAPTTGETDSGAITQSVASFLKGFGQSYERHNQILAQQVPYVCELQNEKDVSTNGYTGREFDLKSCTIPTRARAFTKVVNGQRQMYLGVVFYLEEDANVDRFMKSFTVGPKQNRTR